MKQMNHFICASLVIYRFEDNCNTHIHPIELQVSVFLPLVNTNIDTLT